MTKKQLVLATAEWEAVGMLNDASERHNAGVWSLFSGGDDSLTSTLITSKAKNFRGCLHIDTGIGIPETQAFVRETCQREGWPLLIYRAVDCGQDYDALAVQFGFPGPAAHFRMYVRLKERALDKFIREHKRHRLDRLVLSTGARSHETKRRMGHVEPERRVGAQVWVNSIHNWRKEWCLDYIASRGAPRNPVVEALGMSGECLCGSFASPGELDRITNAYPAVGERIMALEDRVKEAGKPCVWGARPPKSRRKGGEVRDSAGRRRVSELCRQCEFSFMFSGYSS